jgi:hypothetical protein
MLFKAPPQILYILKLLQYLNFLNLCFDVAYNFFILLN